MPSQIKSTNLLLHCIAVALCFLNPACGSAAPHAGDDKGKELFENISAPLGDTWIQKVNGSNPEGAYTYFLQVKGVKEATEADPLSEADKLNGLTWSGRFVWSAEVKREIVVKQRSKAFSAPQIKPWEQGAGRPCTAYNAQQVNGKWTIIDELERYDGKRERPTPEDMQMLAGVLK